MKFLHANPLVSRFIRSGFRRGKGSFNLVWTAFLLGAVLLINTGLWLFRDRFGGTPPYPDAKTFLQSLFWQLIGLQFLNAVVFGALRIYGVVMREKMEESLEFLRISSMRPRTIVAGFALGLQVPGYLLLLVTLPISIVCVLGSDLTFGQLIGAHVVVYSHAAMTSLLALFLGARAEKRAGDALVGLSFLGGILSVSVVMQVSHIGLSAYQAALAFHPLAQLLEIGGNVQHFPSELRVFGFEVPCWSFAAAFGALVVGFLSRVLVEFLARGDRYLTPLVPAIVFHAGVLAAAHALFPDRAGWLGDGELIFWRTTLLLVSLVLVYLLVSGRTVHAERYMLDRGSDRTRSQRPLTGLLTDLIPFAVLHTASDALFMWRSFERVDILAPLGSLVPVAGILALGAASHLGSRQPPGPPRKGLFWVAALVPLGLAFAVAGLSGGEADGPAYAIGAVSPLALASFLSAHGSGVEPWGTLSDAWWMGSALVVYACVMALAYVSATGNRMALERELRMTERGPAALEGEDIVLLEGDDGAVDAPHER